MLMVLNLFMTQRFLLVLKYYNPIGSYWSREEKMDGKGVLISLLSSFLCLYLLFALIKFLHTVWWTPIRLQHALGKQGIKGPAYKFLDGNSKEILKMRKESMSKPMNISSHYLFPRVQPHLYSWMEKYGTNVLHWIGPQPHLFVSDTEMIREILNNKEGFYEKPDTQVFEKKLLGDGISTSRGDKWARSRKLANHAFHGERLKNMFPDMVESSEMMLERWKGHVGKEIEVNEEFRLLTSEVISKTAFGSSYVQGEKIFEMLNKLVEIFARNEYTVRFLSKFVKSADDIEADKLEKGVEESVIEMMKNREEKVMSGKAESFGNDFLGLLIKANHESDKRNRLSVQDVVDECKTFYLAGQENINAMLSWTLFLLAIHTDWQEEARKEVLKVFGQGVPTSDGISKLRIITMIIHETLRLYPPATCVMRKVEREARIGKMILPANLNLYISALAVQHDPEIWGEDVDVYNPKRFSEGVANSVRNNMAAFLPFGLGPRSCVGSNFATTEAKIVLSMILQRYSFTLSSSHVHSPLQLLTILPQHGVQVILHAL